LLYFKKFVFEPTNYHVYIVEWCGDATFTVFNHDKYSFEKVIYLLLIFNKCGSEIVESVNANFVKNFVGYSLRKSWICVLNRKFCYRIGCLAVVYLVHEYSSM